MFDKIPATENSNFIIKNTSWPTAIDIIFPNDEAIYYNQLYLILKYYGEIPYPYLLSILTITENMKEQSEQYKTFFYQSHSAKTIRRLTPFLFKTWYENAWNIHIGYKTEYATAGFRLIFSNKAPNGNILLPTYPWPNSFLNKHNINATDLLLKI